MRTIAPTIPEVDRNSMLGKAMQMPVEIRAELCRRDFYTFVRQMWDTIIEEEPIWNWHIQVICDELQEVAERVFSRQPKEYDLVINIPPGTTKSTICVQMFPAWCWTRDPSLRFICGSYSQALSLEHADYNRDIIRSDRYQSYFPEIILRHDKDLKSNFKNTRYGNRYSTSVGGTVMGMHAHFLMVDDPLNPKQAESTSDINLQAANDWIDRTLSTRKVDKAITPTILIMQRLHLKDPTQHLLDKAKDGKKIRHICLPASLDGSGEVKPASLAKHYKKGLLDPIRLSKEVLAESTIDLGPYGYAGQMDQNPVPKDGGTFNTANIPILKVMPPVHQKIRYWDKAGTKGGGAYTAGVLLARTLNNHGEVDFIVLDVVRGQWSSGQREKIIKQTAEMDGTDVEVWVEQEPGSGGKESAENTIKNLAGFTTHKEAVTGAKELRAEPLASQVEVGNVGLLLGDWNKQFLEELQHFPVGKYKDQVDAASGAFNKIAAQKRAGAW